MVASFGAMPNKVRSWNRSKGATPKRIIAGWSSLKQDLVQPTKEFAFAIHENRE